MRILRNITLSLLFPCLAFTLVSCNNQPTKDITCDDIVRIYTENGYTVWHAEGTEETEYACVVKAYKTDENNYVYFTCFDNAENAKYFAEKRDMRGLFYIFSAIFGNARWHHAERYGNIVVEYEDTALYAPFESLKK